MPARELQFLAGEQVGQNLHHLLGCFEVSTESLKIFWPWVDFASHRESGWLESRQRTAWGCGDGGRGRCGTAWRSCGANGATACRQSNASASHGGTAPGGVTGGLAGGPCAFGSPR